MGVSADVRVEMTPIGHGLVRIRGTVEEVADMLRQAGYPKDAERLLAAEQKRERKARQRRYDAAVAAWHRDPINAPIPEYELFPKARA